MTVRPVTAAWALAILLMIGISAGLLYSEQHRVRYQGMPVAVIGTSLIRNAVPQVVAGGILGDGRRHWRTGISGATESDIVSLLSHAIDEKVDEVLVEANPLLFDFARMQARGRCGTTGREIRSQLAALRRRVTDAFMRRLGRPGELDEVSIPGELDHALVTRPVEERGIYPLALRGPCRLPALRKLTAKAAAEGIEVILVLPPRSSTSERLLTERQRSELDASANRLADILQVQLFNAGGPWPDSEFVDGEHLNRRGRAHFVAALRQWRSSR